MNVIFILLVAAFCAVDAMPFQPQLHFALPPPPGNFFRPSSLMPGAGMRMLSGTYKAPTTPSYTAPASSAPAYPTYPAYPSPAGGYAAPAYYPQQPGHLNINNNNNNDNFNHNSEEAQAQARAYDESRQAASMQNQDLNDILAAYSLQSFLHNAKPAAPAYSSNLYREQPKLKEKYVSSGSVSHYGSTGSSGHHSSGHHSTGYQSAGHHNSGSSHHGSHYDKKDNKSKYLGGHKDTKSSSSYPSSSVPKQIKADYTPKPSNYQY